MKTINVKEIKRNEIYIKEPNPDTIYEQQTNVDPYIGEIKNGFKDFGIREESIRSIKELGFTKPTPIQVQSIPVLRKGLRDFIGLAQTGTGKTAAFGLPLIELLDLEKKTIQALILAPTRELCIQISNDLESYCKYLQGLNIVSIYGGSSIELQINRIKKGAQVVVATPGRLNDLIRRKKIDLSTVKYVILDEADEMLNMGFQEDIDTILAFTPKDRKTWLFAATMPDEIYAIIGKYMHDPFEITAGIKNAGADNIEHIYYVVHERDRYTALKRILDVNPDIFAIVFCRTRMETQEIAEKLIKDGYNADSLHGDLSQVQRDKVMKHYREKNLQLLVATDVAARGIDVNNVSHVINYQLPDEMEIYTHRSGRTARAGKSGITISIINTRDMGKIRYIEKHINKKFIYSKVPGGVEVCEQQLLALMKRIKTVEINQLGISKYLPAITEELKDIDKTELVQRMVSLEFNRFLEYYRNAEDLNIDFSKKDHARGRDNKDAVSIFINLGTIDGFNNGRMLKYFKEITGMPPGAFNRINIKGAYSFVDVKTQFLDGFIEAFDNEVFKGRKVRVDSSSRSRSNRSFLSGKTRNFKKRDRKRF
ncbi:MAG: DEAD/DEAH box helicase [Actinobacteria bacterium]|nr:DEAD/DEAH box helicase [Actinomycetota bacterium]